MSDEPRIDPEVLALLHEVTEDPAARYFEGLRARGPVFTDRLQATSVAAVDLTKAERQLVALHREELAWILMMAAKRENAETEPGQDRFHRWATPHERIALPTHNQWSIHANAWIASPRGPAPELEVAVNLVRKYLARQRTERIAERLARASVQVAPTDTARMHLGLALTFNGAFGEALAALADIVHHRPNDQTSANVWLNIGLTEWMRGHPENTRIAYRSACTAYEFPPGAAMAWLTWCCLDAERSEGVVAAEFVDSYSMEQAQEFVTLVGKQRARGEWAPTEASKETAGFLARRAGDQSREILNAHLR